MRSSLVAASALFLAACGTPASGADHVRVPSLATVTSRPIPVICAPAVVGHRGEPAVAPEETAPAFLAAIRDGARTIEMDVRFTRDLVPFLLHDDTLDRTTDGLGAPERLTLRQIKRLDAGSWRSLKWRGTRVPTLREVLDDARRAKVRAIVELKRPGVTDRQLGVFFDVIRDAGMNDATTVESFSVANLAAARRKAPSMRTALISIPAADPQVALRFGKTLLQNFEQVTAARVLAWHRAGLLVMAWTPDTTAGWRAMRAAGVDAILTNDSKTYSAWAKTGCR
jgi:glycerophosphoryl diester phosphodiesterase